MRDKLSEQRAGFLHPSIRQEVIDTITEIENNCFPKSVMIRLVQGLRTIEEQDDLYVIGRTKPGKIVTNAKGGSSYHNYGLAFDFALMYDTDGNGTYETLSWDVTKDFDKDKIKDWMEVVEAFKAKGWKWGGNFNSFKDYPHLEKSFGYSCKQLKAMYANKQFIKGSRYIKL